MIINRNFRCKFCGKKVEGIKDYSGSFKCLCNNCTEEFYKDDDNLTWEEEQEIIKVLRTPEVKLQIDDGFKMFKK